MTRATLERGEISDLLEDTFFTPEGMKTAVSKAAGIRELLKQYPNIDHVEDDPRTAVYIASLFPDVTVHLVQFGSTGMLYSRQEVDKLPNIRRLGVVHELRK
jgi:hypothetical protein